MRLCGVDVETTGLDKDEHEIIELAWAIQDVGARRPVAFESWLCSGPVVSDKITELTGIDQKTLIEGGLPLPAVLSRFFQVLQQYEVDCLVAHNAPFDRGFIEKAFSKNGMSLPVTDWIDTALDIPFPATIKNRSLVALAAEHGFLNPFPHAALFDVFTMLKMLSQYQIAEVLEFRAEPLVTLRALVDYENRKLASKRGFRWEEFNEVKMSKCWIKQVKKRFVEQEITEANFPVKIV